MSFLLTLFDIGQFSAASCSQCNICHSFVLFLPSFPFSPPPSLLRATVAPTHPPALFSLIYYLRWFQLWGQLLHQVARSHGQLLLWHYFSCPLTPVCRVTHMAVRPWAPISCGTDLRFPCLQSNQGLSSSRFNSKFCPSPRREWPWPLLICTYIIYICAFFHIAHWPPLSTSPVDKNLVELV